MGMLQDHAYYDLDNETRIEVEARNNIFHIEYALLINNVKQDQITGFLGDYKLRGTILSSDSNQPMTVHIHQKLFSTKYVLDIQGKKIPLIQDK